MKTSSLHALVLAGLLLVAAPAAAQTDPQEHDAHHPDETQAAPQPADPGAPPAAGMPGEMPGMTGMMKPEMMQMMMRMMTGQPGGDAAQPGMMRPEMMTGDMMMGDTMMGDMMRGGMMMQMMGALQTGAALHGMMAGHGLALGLPPGAQEEMTPERVRAFLEERLTRQGNARLKLGEIATAEDGSITAEIVTTDGSLVQKLAFNRFPGLYRQLP